MGKHASLPPQFFEKKNGEHAAAAKERRAQVLAGALPSLESLTVEMRPEAQLVEPSLPLWLLSPGVREGAHEQHYARFIQRLDWTALYERYDGEVFFAWLRSEMERFDIALIDSRTGITEIGGVCTRELADLVIELCAPNSQNLKGCEMIARSLFSENLQRERGDRRLQVAIVPTRYENAESHLLLQFEREFKAVVSGLIPANMPSMDAKNMWDLRLPYIPRYAYGEKLCVNTEGRVEDMERPYQKLGRFVASALMRFVPGRAAEFAARSEELAAVTEQAFTLHERMEQAFHALSEAQQRASRPVLLRLIGFSNPADPGSAVAAARSWSRFDVAQQALLGVLATKGIVRVEEAAAPEKGKDATRKGREPRKGKEAPEKGKRPPPEQIVRLPDPAAVSDWSRLRAWLDADRAFLLWRHALDAAISEYERTDKSRFGLLSGAPLREARKWKRMRAGDFDPTESAFVDESVSHTLKVWATVGATFLIVAGTGPFYWWRGEEKVQSALRDTHVTRGTLNLAVNQPLEARKDANAALKIQPKDAEALRLRAKANMQLKEPELALQDYDQVFTLLKADPELLYERASVYESLGEPDAAIEEYGKAISSRLNFSQALYARALLYIEIENPEAAIVDLKGVLRSNAPQDLQQMAKARLREIGEDARSVSRRLSIRYIDPKYKDIVTSLERTMRPMGAEGVELVQPEGSEVQPKGSEVRYFFPQDREYARRVKVRAERLLLQRMGVRVSVVIGAPEEARSKERRPGNVELWLTPLADKR